MHCHAFPNYSKAQVLALPLVLDSGSGLKNYSDRRADLTSLESDIRGKEVPQEAGRCFGLLNGFC